MSDTTVPISKTAILQVVGDVQGEPVDNHDDNLASLADDERWQTLATDIRSEIDRLVTFSLDPNFTVEEIGFRAIAAQLAKEKLQWVLDHVERTRDVQTEPTGT